MPGWIGVGVVTPVAVVVAVVDVTVELVGVPPTPTQAYWAKGQPYDALGGERGGVL